MGSRFLHRAIVYGLPLLAALVAVPGCGDPAGPSDRLLFHLTHVDGRRIPGVIDSTVSTTGTTRISAVAGELQLAGEPITLPLGDGRFTADTTARVTVSLRWDEPDTTRTSTIELVGTYNVEGDSVTMCWHHVQISAVFCDVVAHAVDDLLLRRVLILPAHETRFMRSR